MTCEPDFTNALCIHIIMVSPKIYPGPVSPVAKLHERISLYVILNNMITLSKFMWF